MNRKTLISRIAIIMLLIAIPCLIATAVLAFINEDIARITVTISAVILIILFIATLTIKGVDWHSVKWKYDDDDKGES
jgi:hypothetical protein